VDDYGFVLKQQLGLGAESTGAYNWGGQQEKWITAGTSWYFILPSGALYSWGGGAPGQMITNSTLVAQLHAVYYTTLTRLTAPTSIAASAPVSGTSPAVLTIDPNDNFVGTLRYQATVSDGTSSDSKSFLVTVNTGGPVNQPPQLAAIANQTMTNAQVLNINLSATDPDTPLANLVYTAGLDDYGYVLKQQYGLTSESTGTYNWGGQQEKWFKSGTTWYFILPSGAFYRWGGGTPAQLLSTGTLLAQLHTVYYTTTSRLTAATSIAASAPVSGTAPAVLTVDPNDSFVGTLRYAVTVSDGNSSDTKNFLVTVNQA
jgi:hypothetical protein